MLCVWVCVCVCRQSIFRSHNRLTHIFTPISMSENNETTPKQVNTNRSAKKGLQSRIDQVAAAPHCTIWWHNSSAHCSHITIASKRREIDNFPFFFCYCSNSKAKEYEKNQRFKVDSQNRLFPFFWDAMGQKDEIDFSLRVHRRSLKLLLLVGAYFFFDITFEWHIFYCHSSFFFSIAFYISTLTAVIMSLGLALANVQDVKMLLFDRNVTDLTETLPLLRFLHSLLLFHALLQCTNTEATMK